jgi:hypothetical protein
VTDATTADLSRFDSDSDALAWARAKVQQKIDRCREFERQCKDKGDSEQASAWRKRANMMHMWFIGGEGCVIAAFDERFPQVVEMRATSEGSQP